jgi:hypothetical protein
MTPRSVRIFTFALMFSPGRAKTSDERSCAGDFSPGRAKNHLHKK